MLPDLFENPNISIRTIDAIVAERGIYNRQPCMRNCRAVICAVNPEMERKRAEEMAAFEVYAVTLKEIG